MEARFANWLQFQQEAIGRRRSPSSAVSSSFAAKCSLTNAISLLLS